MPYKNTYQTVCNGVHIKIKLHVRNFGLHFSNNKKKGNNVCRQFRFGSEQVANHSIQVSMKTLLDRNHPRVVDVNRDIIAVF